MRRHGPFREVCRVLALQAPRGNGLPSFGYLEAESALRRVALGRKNFLFTGNDESGRNITGLYSLVATCEANGVNPVAYLADILMHVHTHPMSRNEQGPAS